MIHYDTSRRVTINNYQSATTRAFGVWWEQLHVKSETQEEAKMATFKGLVQAVDEDHKEPIVDTAGLQAVGERSQARGERRHDCVWKL